jgi:hypothetical protein
MSFSFFDLDGRLHVPNARISRAGVHRYRESDLGVALGGDTTSIYRPPGELEKAAASFNNIHVLSCQVDYQDGGFRPIPEEMVGVTGDNTSSMATILPSSTPTQSIKSKAASDESLPRATTSASLLRGASAAASPTRSAWTIYPTITSLLCPGGAWARTVQSQPLPEKRTDQL